MKKLSHPILLSLVAVALLTGCGGKKKQLVPCPLKDGDYFIYEQIDYDQKTGIMVGDSRQQLIKTNRSGVTTAASKIKEAIKKWQKLFRKKK